MPFFAEASVGIYMDVSENSVFSPQIIHFNRVFHEINHPFWGTGIFGNTHIDEMMNPKIKTKQVGEKFLGKKQGNIMIDFFSHAQGAFEL